MDEGAVPETESILKLMAIMDDKSEVKFKCAGSLYYFSTNFVFAVEKVDGSLVYATSGSTFNSFKSCLLFSLFRHTCIF